MMTTSRTDLEELPPWKLSSHRVLPEVDSRFVAMTESHRAVLRTLLPFLLLSCVTGCAGSRRNSYNGYLQTWVGSSTDRLTRIWGPPQHTAQRPDGSSLMEYRERSVERVAAPVGGGANAPVSLRLENRVSWCITRFTVRNSVVESVTYEGADCRAP